MTIVHDADKGWSTHHPIFPGPPTWRSTTCALNRATGAQLEWTVVPRRGHVAHAGGKNFAVIRYYPTARRWQVRIEGFEFWHFNRILRKECFDPVLGFGKIREARRFAVSVLRQAGARISA
jgi:hypothetical protein